MASRLTVGGETVFCQQARVSEPTGLELSRDLVNLWRAHPVCWANLLKAYGRPRQAGKSDYLTVQKHRGCSSSFVLTTSLQPNWIR